MNGNRCPITSYELHPWSLIAVKIYLDNGTHPGPP